MTVKVKVNPGWQLGLPEGKLHFEGDMFDVPDALAQEWISSGQASPVKAEKKAVTASKNKAVPASRNKAAAPPQSFTATPKPPDPTVSEKR